MHGEHHDENLYILQESGEKGYHFEVEKVGYGL
jgi:hypothetical protein